RSAELQDMARKLDAGERVSAEPEIAEESSRGRTQLGMSKTSVPPLEAPKRGRAAIVAFVIGLAATAAGAAWLTRQDPQQATVATQAPATPAPAIAAPTGTSAPNLRQVVITLRASPEQARLSIDGSPPEKSPLVLRVAADGQTRQVIASASGYQDKVSSVTFDSDQTLELALEPSSRTPRRPNAVHVGAEHPPAPPPA